MTMGEKRSQPTSASAVRRLTPAELHGCRGGGDHEDLWLWVIMGTLPPWDSPIDPITGTGPTCPPPPG